MKEYWCKKCSMQFGSNYNLNRHINSVHRKKSGSKTAKKKQMYKCVACKYETDRKDTLNRHMKSNRCKINKTKALNKTRALNKIEGTKNITGNINGNKNKMIISKDKINVEKINVILLNFPPDKYTILKDLPKILKSDENVIMSIIKKTNLNKKKPENHNIY